MIGKGLLLGVAAVVAILGLVVSKKGAAAGAGAGAAGTTPGGATGPGAPGATTGLPAATTGVPGATTTVPGTTVSTTPGTVTPSSALPGANLIPPADVLAKIVTSTGSGDPAQMRKVADEIDAQGWKSQAADLRAAADVLERAKAQNVLTQVQTTIPTGPQIVDGSSWLLTHGNASTGYQYLQDPSGQQWPVAPGKVQLNSLGTYDYTLTDGRVVRNPKQSPNYYTEGGVVVQTPPVAPPTQTVLPDIQGTGWTLDLTQSITTGNAILTSPTGTTYTVSASQIAVDTSGNRRVTIPNVGIVVNPTIKAGALTVPGAEVAVPPITPPVISPPVVPTPPGVEDSKAALAGQLAGALTGATTANEPHTVITAFEAQEGLEQDGLYGTADALRLAQGYNIVPPNPLHWGTKAGGYTSYVNDKKTYAATLKKIATTDTARADQWNKAAALALKGI